MWLIIVISLATSIVFLSVIEAMVLIRALFFKLLFEDMEIVAFTALPVVIYTWITLCRKNFIKMFNKIDK